MVYAPQFKAPELGQGCADLPDLPPTASATVAPTTTRAPATRATTTRCSSCPGTPCRRASAATTSTATPTAPGASTPPRPPTARPRSSRAAATIWAATCKGVEQQLNYLQALGVTAIYFNPIFDAGSNHSYDTQNYTRIDPYFGTQQDWDSLVKQADKRGIASSSTACSTTCPRTARSSTAMATTPRSAHASPASSPYRSWFHFRAPTGNEPAHLRAIHARRQRHLLRRLVWLRQHPGAR